MGDIIAYSYYTSIYGPRIDSNAFQLYFLSRRGGYAHANGVILNQSYLVEQVPFDKEQIAALVAHEVTHLWWSIDTRIDVACMNESMAEYSCDAYLTSRNIMDPKSRYARKNLHVLNDHLVPANWATIPYMDKRYKAFAYNKGPILLHELELKIGRVGLLQCLSKSYRTSRDASGLMTIHDLIQYMPTRIQSEFEKDINGTLASWPDYSIQNVSDNTVVFEAHEVYFPEVVPIEITLTDRTVITDTLAFDKSSTTIEKQYTGTIAQVVIDSGFSTNQSNLLNDIWIKDTHSMIHNKWDLSYDKHSRDFFEALLTYLFTSEEVSIEDKVGKDNLSVMKKMKTKLEHLELDGTVIGISDKKHYFKIVVSFPHNGHSENGYIDGYFYRQNGVLHLQSINRVDI